jgi:murein DD-endopeptidase MepM/ murein hydrolase activator NlpD
MALTAVDRLLTIAVTATLTSAVWIVGDDALMSGAGGLTGVGTQGGAGTTRDAATRKEASPVLETRAHNAPTAREGRDLIIPVVGVGASDLVDTFTQARAGGARVHDAIDIMADEGASIVAAAPGKIEKLFFSKAGGKTIYLRSPDRQTIYYYAHLRDYEPGLAEGQSVQRGQRIGSVGHTGNADPAGPHLHFAIMSTTPDAAWWEPTTAINPYPLLKSR